MNLKLPLGDWLWKFYVYVSGDKNCKKPAVDHQSDVSNADYGVIFN